MYDRRLVAGGAAVGLVAVAIIAFVLAAPRLAASGLNGLAQQQLGRSVIVRGGTHLDFSPLSIRLDDAVLSGVDARDDSFAMARRVAREEGIPVGISSGAALTAALAEAGPDEVVLVDCATLWLTNHLLAEHDLDAEGAALLAACAACLAPVVVVSNEVGWGIVPDNALARRFRDAQGRLNQRIAAEAGLVVGVMAGLPMVLKGAMPPWM